jgi:hypothetical protein
VSNGKSSFRFKLSKFPPDYRHCSLRICIYRDPYGTELIAKSQPFRPVLYKVKLTGIDFPEPDGKYYYEVGDKTLKFRVDVVDAMNVPFNQRVCLRCDVYSKEGDLNNSVITRPHWNDERGESYWRNEAPARQNDDLVPLPTNLLFGCRNSVHNLIFLRVSVVAIGEGNSSLLSYIGSGQTTSFTVYSKHPDYTKQRRADKSTTPVADNGAMKMLLEGLGSVADKEPAFREPKKRRVETGTYIISINL